MPQTLIFGLNVEEMTENYSRIIKVQMQQAQNIHVTRNHVPLVDLYLVRDPLRELETGRVWGRYGHFCVICSLYLV